MRFFKRFLLIFVLAMLVIAGVGLAVIFWQGSAEPDQSGEYVALGSSFAAGPSLGPLSPGSPYACWRTTENYAHRLARDSGLHLVDVSCGGATASNILKGGPFFQPPQINAVGSSARLVTITVGGNDVNYIGDLGLLAYRDSGGLIGALVRATWDGPLPADSRPFDELVLKLVDIVDAVRQRSPQATVVLMTYPRVLPSNGTCESVKIGAQEAALMREVAQRLSQATGMAASRSGAEFVDMANNSEGHDACSGDPWVNGFTSKDGTMYHPNLAGAAAAEKFLAELVRQLRSQDRF